MNGAAFAEEAGAKFLQHAVGGQQNLPEAPCIVGIVRGMYPVLAEGCCGRDLAGIFVDGDRNTEIVKRRHQRAVKLRDALRPQREAPHAAVADGDVERMLDEIELNLEGARSMRNGR